MRRLKSVGVNTFERQRECAVVGISMKSLNYTIVTFSQKLCHDDADHMKGLSAASKK